MKQIKKENWIWMGHAGHFIVSDKCIFHLNTYVGKYIVSTVGEYWPERSSREIHASVCNPKWLKENKDLKGDYFDVAYMKEFGFENIGSGDKDVYETMVFKAKKSKNKCCPYRQVSGEDVECVRYETPEEAMKGHLTLCKKWSQNAIRI